MSTEYLIFWNIRTFSVPHDVKTGSEALSASYTMSI
jgi:cAMP phosphodiesterase